MKLYTSPLSPFARKCRIVAHELDLADLLELVPQSVSPVAPDPDYLKARNPLGKLPALLLDDGRVLFDSHVICEYLLWRAGDTRLVPPGPGRFDVLTRQALASGMTDAIILVRYETALRPIALQWEAWRDGQLGKFEAGLATFESDVGDLEADLDLAQIALVCGLAYADVRFPTLGWRDRAPRVAALFERLSHRASFAETAPPPA